MNFLKPICLVSLLLIGLTFDSQLIAQDTRSSELLFDLDFSDSERSLMEDGLKDNLEVYRALHQYSISNSTPSAIQFNQMPLGFKLETDQKEIKWDLKGEVSMPENLEQLAFYSVADLSILIKSQKITSLQLTKIYLKRLEQHSDTLQCVVTLTKELALKQAKKADEEIASGNYRGPLHGMPYGVKDLFAVKGYNTTWGTEPYKDQVIDQNAAVVQKLEDAGAVLLAKLTLGALAWGDVWFGGQTKNPWNLEQGSSGSSAGSASATSAGLVGFAIGTETLGSITSPSTRCGTSGLRPTFGRVSRTGGMNLSWSMDKVGPITRSALDAALVFEAIRGADGVDQAVKDASFNYRPINNLSNIRVGYIKDLFDADYEGKANDSTSLSVLKSLGADLKPVSLPDDLPLNAFGIILSAEAAAAFDELTRSNRDSLMVRQIKRAWPNVFRQSRFVPAVEYINANRVRYLLIQELHKRFSEFDVIVTPTFGGDQLQFTNLTGHPVVVVPNGFTEEGSPTSISFLGNLFDEAAILAVARLYQGKTQFDELHPPYFQP